MGTVVHTTRGWSGFGICDIRGMAAARRQGSSVRQAVRIPIRVGAAAIAVAILVTGCGGTGGVESAPLVVNAGTPGLLITPAGMRPQAPRIEGPLLQGGSLDMDDYAGQVVLLNAYASWCPPCLEELPELAAADRDLPNLQVIGVNVSDTPKAGLEVLEATGADFPAVFDPRGLQLAAFTATPTQGLPFSIIIDEQGRVAGRIIGPATMPMLEQAIAQIAR